MKTLVTFVWGLIIGVGAFAADTPYNPATFAPWLAQETVISQTKILESMSYRDLAPGALVASPSRRMPDYYYHWVRDAGLVMDVVVDLYKKKTPHIPQAILEKKINDFITFSRSNQAADALTGIGEPKFYVNGAPYNLPWGRPQNDGPALRALALIKWANVKLEQGDSNYVRRELYDGQYNSKSVIKVDLEYVAQTWAQPSFDLWEELSGDHFFTRVVQRSSLIQGAELARKMNDLGASDWYLKQASRIEASLLAFTHSSYAYIPATLNFSHGLEAKKSNLDVAVLIGMLRGRNTDYFLPWNNPRVVQTIDSLVEAFYTLYPINQRSQFPGVAIGRYSEDVYSGEDYAEGNPWVLTTLAVAESYYEMAKLEASAPTVGAREYQIQRATALIQKGDLFFQRVHVHANPDGSLSEQINRHTGYMMSANNLTWSYAAVLTANWAREKAIEALK